MGGGSESVEVQGRTVAFERRGDGASAGPGPRSVRRQPRLAPAARSPLRRVLRRRLGRAGLRPLVRPAGGLRAGWVRGLPGGVHRGARPRPPARGRPLIRLRPGPGVVPPPSGAAAHLVLASAYAGWAGSLGREVAEERRRWGLRAAERPLDEFVRDFGGTLCTASVPADVVEETLDVVTDYQPAGLRAW